MTSPNVRARGIVFFSWSRIQAASAAFGFLKARLGLSPHCCSRRSLELADNDQPFSDRLTIAHASMWLVRLFLARRSTFRVCASQDPMKPLHHRYQSLRFVVYGGGVVVGSWPHPVSIPLIAVCLHRLWSLQGSHRLWSLQGSRRLWYLPTLSRTVVMMVSHLAWSEAKKWSTFPIPLSS